MSAAKGSQKIGRSGHRGKKQICLNFARKAPTQTRGKRGYICEGKSVIRQLDHASNFFQSEGIQKERIHSRRFALFVEKCDGRKKSVSKTQEGSHQTREEGEGVEETQVLHDQDEENVQEEENNNRCQHPSEKRLSVGVFPEEDTQEKALISIVDERPGRQRTKTLIFACINTLFLICLHHLLFRPIKLK